MIPAAARVPFLLLAGALCTLPTPSPAHESGSGGTAAGAASGSDSTAPGAIVPDPPIQPGPTVPGRETASIQNPYRDDPKAIEEGARLYTWYNCSGCHAPRGGGGMGPPLSDDAWIHGDDAASIFESIHEGRPNGMPTWAGMIPEEAIWKIVAFIQALPPDDPPVPAGE